MLEWFVEHSDFTKLTLPVSDHAFGQGVVVSVFPGYAPVHRRYPATRFSSMKALLPLNAHLVEDGKRRDAKRAMGLALTRPDWRQCGGRCSGRRVGFWVRLS